MFAKRNKAEQRTNSSLNCLMEVKGQQQTNSSNEKFSSLYKWMVNKTRSIYQLDTLQVHWEVGWRGGVSAKQLCSTVPT